MDIPKYLNCPWCSAQSFLAGSGENVNEGTARYVCPAKHTFYVEVEKENEVEI